MSDLTPKDLMTEFYKFIYSADVELILRAGMSNPNFEGYDEDAIKVILAQLQIVAEERAEAYRKHYGSV